MAQPITDIKELEKSEEMMHQMEVSSACQLLDKTGHVNNIPTMQFMTRIPWNTLSKYYIMLSLTEHAWEIWIWAENWEIVFVMLLNINIEIGFLLDSVRWCLILVQYECFQNLFVLSGALHEAAG